MAAATGEAAAAASRRRISAKMPETGPAADVRTEDAPEGHEAYQRVQCWKGQLVYFKCTNLHGEHYMELKVSQCKGSQHEAERIMRLCYMRLQANVSREDALHFQDTYLESAGFKRCGRQDKPKGSTEAAPKQAPPPPPVPASPRSASVPPAREASRGKRSSSVPAARDAGKEAATPKSGLAGASTKAAAVPPPPKAGAKPEVKAEAKAAAKGHAKKAKSAEQLTVPPTAPAAEAEAEAKPKAVAKGQAKKAKSAEQLAGPPGPPPAPAAEEADAAPAAVARAKESPPAKKLRLVKTPAAADAAPPCADAASGQDGGAAPPAVSPAISPLAKGKGGQAKKGQPAKSTKGGAAEGPGSTSGSAAPASGSKAAGMEASAAAASASDSPIADAAADAVRTEGDSAVFTFAVPGGAPIEFRTAASACGNSVAEAERIARLCYVAFQDGRTEDQVKYYRNCLLTGGPCFLPPAAARAAAPAAPRPQQLPAGEAAATPGPPSSGVKRPAGAAAKKRLKLARLATAKAKAGKDPEEGADAGVGKSAAEEGKAAVGKANPLEQLGKTPDWCWADAPEGHAAHAKVKGPTKLKTCGFEYNCDNVRTTFQTTVMACRGSVEEAMRICRLCYVKFTEGCSKAEVTDFRNRVYSRCGYEVPRHMSPQFYMAAKLAREAKTGNVLACLRKKKHQDAAKQQTCGEGTGAPASTPQKRPCWGSNVLLRGAKKSLGKREAEIDDAPPEHIAWKRCRTFPDRMVTSFEYTFLENSRPTSFQTTTRRCGGSVKESERICRLCFLKFEAGWHRDQVLAFRETEYRKCGLRRVFRLKHGSIHLASQREGTPPTPNSTQQPGVEVTPEKEGKKRAAGEPAKHAPAGKRHLMDDLRQAQAEARKFTRIPVPWPALHGVDAASAISRVGWKQLTADLRCTANVPPAQVALHRRFCGRRNPPARRPLMPGLAAPSWAEGGTVEALIELEHGMAPVTGLVINHLLQAGGEDLALADVLASQAYEIVEAWRDLPVDEVHVR